MTNIRNTKAMKNGIILIDDVFKKIR